ERPYPVWQLPRLWPKADWPQSIREAAAKGQRDRVQILQGSYYDEEIRGWRLAIVLCEGDASKIVFSNEHRTNPWIIPRWWTTPGDSWGYGPLLLTLPDIKTANKTVEMILRAAAFSLA